jgi:hypothetical protein
VWRATRVQGEAGCGATRMALLAWRYLHSCIATRVQALCRVALHVFRYKHATPASQTQRLGRVGLGLIGKLQVLGHRLDALRCLRLVDVTNLTDDALMGMLSGARMTALEELSLSGCIKVRGGVLAQVCTRFPSLKVLLPVAARAPAGA